MQTIINQILIMAILIGVGYGLCKTQFIDQSVTKSLSNILLRFIIPLTIIEAFIEPFSWHRLQQLGLVSILSVFLTILLIIIANLFFKENQRIEKYASIFSNKGFVGIPIVSAIFSKEAVAIITPVIVVSNIFAWTYGLSLLHGKKMSLNLKSFIMNPSVIGLIIGLFMFILPIDYPYPIVRSLTYLTSLNTPLAMIVLGAYLADESMLKVFSNKAGYKVASLRLLLMPMIVMVILMLLPLDFMVRNVLIVAMAVPTAANTAMFAQMTGSNYSHGAQIVCLTTILSGLTLPFILYFIYTLEVLI